MENTQTTYLQRNKLRFFYPQDWFRFLSVISNPKHAFQFKLLLNTGLRVNEARNLKVKDINLDRKYLTVIKGKGNKQRQPFFSTMFKSELQQYINSNKLTSDDNFGLPSTQFLDKIIKQYAAKAGLENPKDFCCHSFRKTHENYLCAKGVNTMLLTQHMGHTVNVAVQYYVSQFMKPEEKQLIKSIIGDLFDG